MAETTPAVNADARNRAFRTFMQGLVVDIIAALSITVLPALAGSEFVFSRVYFTTLAILVGKTVVVTAVSYIARKLLPPPAASAR